eukprot:365627-Chlamydomonas_euryale.AAC.5
MDQYIVRDPILRDDALDAQELLQAELPGYEPKWCEYEINPFWFKLHGDDSEQVIADMYKEQVMMQAPGFAEDKGLREAVLNDVRKMLTELDNTPSMVDQRDMKLEYQGITFILSVTLDKYGRGLYG